MKGQQEEKDEIMSQLQTRLKHLAMDVGERELRLSSAKAMYLKESREYKNSRDRRANGRGSFAEPGTDDRPYPAAGGSYSSYSPWADSRYAKGDTKYTTSWAGLPRGRPKSTPWGSSPMPQQQAVPKWKYRIPDNELKKISNIPDNEWAICWNFNTTRGCPRGANCSWRHDKYSSAVNHPITREPLKAGAPKRLTTQGRRQTTILKPLQPETLESENKSEEDKTGWPAEAAEVAGYTTNAKTRDTDTDSKEEKSSAFGYNGNEPPGTGSEESGVE